MSQERTLFAASIYLYEKQILNMKDEEVFLNYINENYDSVKSTLQILSGQRHQAFDEDIFHDTILRCHKTIEKRGELKDKTPYGITSYLIRSYFTNILEDKRSAKNAKRDLNYDTDNINELYEDWYNSNNSDAKNKILTDTFKDFSVLYLMLKAEENFDQEHFYLFRLKELVPDMTYKKLQEQTHIKGARQKVVAVKSWLKNNVTKEDIKKSFYQAYGNLI